MALKEDLQAIEPEAMRMALAGHIQKFDSLPDADHEFDQQEHPYPALAGISPTLFELLVVSGFPEHEARLISVGASLAVHVVIEIAEVDALPPLS